MKMENTTEEYLEAIFKQNHEENRATTASIASFFGITYQSAREKIKNLKKNGYAESEKEFIILTKAGEKRAKDVIRKHRLSEIFLTQTLGLPWDEVHEEACLFEHVLSDKVADALEKFLGYPENCPHGHPIPDKEGRIKEQELLPLTKLNPGDRAKVVELEENSRDILKELMALGILPGSIIELKQIAPFRGAYLISVNETSHYSISPVTAEKIKTIRE